jgi:hypothetical protein
MIPKAPASERIGPLAKDEKYQREGQNVIIVNSKKKTNA